MSMMFELPLFQESDHNHERGPCTGENTETECVVKWLRNLGLSKYEEIFTKEEVDWETLQWLTEEVVTALISTCRFIFQALELKLCDIPSYILEVVRGVESMSRCQPSLLN
jgi:hypothetical protein